MNKKFITAMAAILAMKAGTTSAEELSLDSSPLPLVPVTKSETSKTMKELEASAKLNGVEIKIRDCKTIFSVSARENISHVASCTLNPTRFPVMICNDKMSGSFALAVTFAKSPTDMASFLKNHCHGG